MIRGYNAKALKRCATLAGILFAVGCTDRGTIM